MRSLPRMPVALSLAVLVTLSACSGKEPLPKSVYEGHDGISYEELPPALQSMNVDLMYVTDRAPETDEDGNLRYGIGRSQSLAFGSVVVKS